MMTDNADWKISPPEQTPREGLHDQGRSSRTQSRRKRSRVDHDSREVQRRATKRRSVLAQAEKEKEKKRFKIPAGLLLLGSLFLLMLFSLVLQTWIFSLNKDVRYLQDELNSINSEIDSKNGRIISNADLKTIESQARSLGMTEARPSQYIYESAAKKQTAITKTPVGLYDYISFLVQVRSEGLWPANH